MINNFSANKVKAELVNTNQCRYIYTNIYNHHRPSPRSVPLSQAISFICAKISPNFICFFYFLIKLPDLSAFHVQLILFQVRCCGIWFLFFSISHLEFYVILIEMHFFGIVSAMIWIGYRYRRWEFEKFVRELTGLKLDCCFRSFGARWCVAFVPISPFFCMISEFASFCWFVCLILLRGWIIGRCWFLEFRCLFYWSSEL